MTTPPAPAPAAPAAGGSLVSRVGGPRNAAVLGAGLTVAAVALLGMLRSKGANSNTAATGESPYDSGPYDMWNQWQAEYEQLQEQINSQGGGSTSAGGGPATTPKPPPPVQIPKPPAWPPPVSVKPPVVRPKPTPYKTVTVKKGDTLSAIAKKNNISMATLKKLNPVYWTNKKYKNGNLIWAGDKVKV
jgi:LysM repeat protein